MEFTRTLCLLFYSQVVPFVNENATTAPFAMQNLNARLLADGVMCTLYPFIRGTFNIMLVDIQCICNFGIIKKIENFEDF